VIQRAHAAFATGGYGRPTSRIVGDSFDVMASQAKLLLDGVPIEQIPVVQSTRFRFGLNLKACHAAGVAPPQEPAQARRPGVDVTGAARGSRPAAFYSAAPLLSGS